MSSMRDIHSVIKPLMESLVGSVVEIGSDRGGGSTRALSELCENFGLKFYSVDFEEGAFLRAQEIIGDGAYQMTGEFFLSDVFPKEERICLAYLDNFDLVWPAIEEKPRVLRIAKLYQEYGFEMTNTESKRVHLLQCIEIEKLAAGKCIVVLDDTWFRRTGFDGKGGLAAPHLVKMGFNLFHVTTGPSPHHCFIMLERGLK